VTNMVFSMHPHAIAADGVECLYMQDTWLVTEDGGVPLAGLPMQNFPHGRARGSPARRRGGVQADPARRGRERLRALPPYRRAARSPEGAGRVGAPRRAPLPDRPPVVGALAQACVDGGGGGDAADRGAWPRRRAATAAAGERRRAPRRLVPRAPRAHVAVGVPGG